MNRKLMELAEKYVVRRKHRMRLLRTVTALALVVAICTSYVLMMPGLTMAAETYCGLEEHTHTADCYVDELTCLIPEREATTVFTDIMRCTFEPHRHSADCYNAVGELSCGYWDSYIHEHDEKCYDANGILICTLEEHPMHKHTDSCYAWDKQLTCTLEESEGHVHTADCYRAKEPTCGLFENDGHVHTDACVTETRTLICTEDIATDSDMPHVHDDGCYEVTRAYTCGLTEGEGAHHHTDDCYPTTEEPTCGLFEGEGAHTHDDSCYETVRGNLQCKLYPDPAKVHTHSASCVDAKTGYYTCGYIQVLRHQHTDACIVTVTAEDSGHHHTADCYERNYTCGMEEHTHTADCYYNATPNPDETEEPTEEPEATPVPTEEVEVTAEPTEDPETTVEPTEEPSVTPAPVEEPTVEVTEEPTVTPAPTEEATAEPTEEPTETPAPTEEVTAEPTAEPTETPAPTEEVTAEPTVAPTETPAPTEEVTAEPTVEPSETPAPTEEVTAETTVEPSEAPAPTEEVTAEPTEEVTAEPTVEPTETPAPTEEVTATPAPDATADPTEEPSPTPEITVIPPMNDIAIQPATDMDHGFVVTAADDDDMDSLVIKSVSASNFVTGDNTYQYDFSAKIAIDTDRIGKHDKNNPIKIPADKFHYRVTDADNQAMNGTDNSYNDTNPAFKFRYNPQDDTIEMWFTDDYIAWTEEKIKKETDYKTANGSMKMIAEIRKDDIKDLDDKDLEIGFGGATTTIKSEDVNPGDNSILSDLTTSKNGGQIDWKTGTIKYWVDINTTKGTNGESVTLEDIMSATNQNITLTGMNVTNVNKNWATSVPAVDSDLTTVVTDGSVCGCGTTGNHIHYKHQMDTNGNAHTATTDYVLPPLEANESYRVEYVYTFDKTNWNGEFDKMTNHLTAESGSKWDHTEDNANKDIDITTDKLQKSGYDSKDGYVTWTVTVNSNYFNIKDKALTDTMLGAVIGEDGKLLFAAADGSGYVKEIKATATDGSTITINGDNYEDYFTVTKGEDGKATLTFKDTDCLFQITYKTPVEASSTTQVISNDAEFDDDTAHRDVSVQPDERYTVAKTVSADMPKDPSKGSTYTDGLYPVTWNTTYQFAATENVKYKLSFGDEIEPDGWRGNRPRHYMTAEQAQELLDTLLASGIAQAHQAQNVPFRIVMYTYDESLNTRSETVAYSYDGETATTGTLSGHYYGFKFETVGAEGVILNTDNEEMTQLTYNLSYATTVYLDQNRTGQIDLHNRATNAAKTSDAYYKIYPNDLVDKKYGNHGVGNLTGDNKITIHEDTLYWTIELRSDGDAHDEITLSDTLPPHILVDSIEYGGSTLVRSETDDTKLTVAEKKTDNVGTIPEGYEVSSKYNEAKISIKADLTMVGEGANQRQKITISMKPNENQGNPTILNGPHNMTIRIRCKIDPTLMEDKNNALWQNDQLKFGELDNHLEVKYGTEGDLITKDQVTDLTYEEEKVEPKNVQKGYKVTPGLDNAKITYTVDINQSGAELNPQGSTLQLNDTLKYDQVGTTGHPENYVYLRNVTVDDTSFKLYYAMRDENGNPILTVDEAGKGHLVPGAEVPKYLWKIEFDEEEANYNTNYNYGTTVSGSKPAFKQLKMTVTVPDGEALILEYTVREDIQLPPEVTNEYNLGQVRSKGIDPALTNTANLSGISGSDTVTVDKNDAYFSRGEGYINYGLVIRKVDSANNSLLLPGTEFTLYAWNEAQEKFVPVDGNGGKIYTNSNGQLTFDYDQSKLNERPLNPNTAYLLVETKAVTPYNLVLEDRPIIVFHVPANPQDDAANPPHYPGDYDKTTFGSLTAADLVQYIPASEIPGVINGVYTVNGSGTISIQMQNSKDRRDLNVVKNWQDESADTRPDSVHVFLRRYALTESQYNHMLEMSQQQVEKATISAEIACNGGNVTTEESFAVGTVVTVHFAPQTDKIPLPSGSYMRINGEEMTKLSDGEYVKTITLTADTSLKLEYWKFGYGQDPVTGEWHDCWHDAATEFWYANVKLWITYQPSSMFTDEQWNYIKQYPDESYGGREGTLTAANGWTTGWNQLESTGATADGHKLYYIYYIVEGKVPYYTTSGITYTIDPNASKTTGTVTAELLNTYRPENLYGEINFDVSKEWYAADGTKHTITEGFEGVQVALYKTRWDYDTTAKTWTKGASEHIYTTTLAEANKWGFKTNALETYTVEKLNGAVVGAHAYTYSIVELNTPSGYESRMQVSGVPQDPWDYFNDNSLSSPKSEFAINTTIRGTVTLKNVAIEQMRLDVVKHWKMVEYIHYDPSDTLTFRLTREIQQNGEWVTDETFAPVDKTLTLTDLADKRIGLGEYPKFTVTGFDESGAPIKAYYRYKVEETQYNGGNVPFRISYEPADAYVTAQTAGAHETVTVTNTPSEISGLYRFNVTKQWYDANLTLMQTSKNPDDDVASITVTRKKHVYDPATEQWTVDSTETEQIDLTESTTYTELWETWNEAESVHVEYKPDGTVKSAWAYTYEVKEETLDKNGYGGYDNVQLLPADLPQEPSDYFVDGDMTNIKPVYRQPQPDTLPEVVEKNYYIEWFRVRVNKTWARLRDTDSIKFTLVRAPIIGQKDDGTPIYGDRNTWEYIELTNGYTEANPNPVWEFSPLPKYKLEKNADGTVTLVWYQYWITEMQSPGSQLGYQVTYTYDADKKNPLTMDSNEPEWGIVEQPEDGAEVDIYAENAPVLEVGSINFTLTKVWDATKDAKLPESVTLVLIPTLHQWDNAAKKWNSTPGNQIEITMKPDDKGVWQATDKQLQYSVELNPDGTIKVAPEADETVEIPTVCTYELVEVLTSSAEPSYSFEDNWPKTVGDILELAEEGTPIRVKANVSVGGRPAGVDYDGGSTLYTVLNTSATVTNKLGKLTIEKKWAKEPAYDGAQNPLGITEVSVTLLRQICEGDTTDENGKVVHHWVYNGQQGTYIIEQNEDGRWLLTINDLPLYDDKNGCPYRYYMMENPRHYGNPNDVNNKNRYYKAEYSGEGTLDEWGTFYFTFTNAESSAVMTNVPKNLTIDKVWKDGEADGQFAEERELDIYLYIEKTSEDYPGHSVTENAVEKNTYIADAQYLKLSPDNLQVTREEINGKWYLHVQGKTKDANWRITLINVASEENATFTIREVELAGYLNNLPDGKLEMGFNEVGTITNTPTKLTITKQFMQEESDGITTTEKALNVRNADVYLQVWRAKVDEDGRFVDDERYTPALGTLASNMNAEVLPDGTVKLTVGTETAASSATLTLTRLPRYWVNAATCERGEWVYYVKEVDADGNEVHAAYMPTSGVTPDTGLNAPNITLTNTLTDISVRKVWVSLENQVTLNPANLPDITLTLMQTKSESKQLDDVKFATVTLGWDAESGTIAVKNATGWTHGEVTDFRNSTEGSKNLWWGYKWTELPAYAVDGSVYHYYVVEETPVSGGWQLETSSPATTGEPISSIASDRVFQITNTPITYVLPETGGVGTLPYTAGGLLLMAAAAMLLAQEIKHRREGC